MHNIQLLKIKNIGSKSKLQMSTYFKYINFDNDIAGDITDDSTDDSMDNICSVESIDSNEFDYLCEYFVNEEKIKKNTTTHDSLDFFYFDHTSFYKDFYELFVKELENSNFVDNKMSEFDIKKKFTNLKIKARTMAWDNFQKNINFKIKNE